MLRSVIAVVAIVLLAAPSPPPPQFDLVIRRGLIVDGTGGQPYRGDVAVVGDRIVAIGAHVRGSGREEIDATGRAVTPGFINMLSQANESLFADGRALSDLAQGVTLEVTGEGDSMAPLTPEMQRWLADGQGDIRYPVTWATLDGYLRAIEGRGIAVNIASYVGAATVRAHVLGRADVQPDAAQLRQMQKLVEQAMEDGAVGVSSALIYPPGSFAGTSELIALAKTAGRCGGGYFSHVRSEGARFVEAVDELIEIARRSGTPAEIFHLKVAGRANWPKLDTVIAHVEAARARGQRITADAYLYDASSTGLDAAMPPWVQEGGIDAWVARLRDPALRARLIAEMRADDAGFENRLRQAGAAGVLLVGFRNPVLKPLIGKTLAAVAQERGTSAEETAIDLVIEDHGRVDVIYRVMSEANVRRTVQLPWVSFGSDGAALAPEGIFLKSSTHPRAYGNFARLLGRYVRDEKLLSLQEAVRRMTSLPAATLGLADRGRLANGFAADLVVLDPARVADTATYELPRALARGIDTVVVNGQIVWRDNRPTGVTSGRAVRGRSWRGRTTGGCRASSDQWRWP